nr:hypothetical protein [Allomuricauda sp.]
MKKVAVSIMVLTMFNMVQAQGDRNRNFLIETPIVTNSKYYLANQKSGSPEIIQMIQEKIARFNVSSAKGFAKSNEELFEVVFRSENGATFAYYDNEGKVVATLEKFRDVSLPLDIRKRLSKDFENWKIIGNSYISQFESGKITRKEYKIELSKEGKTKKLVVHASGS